MQLSLSSFFNKLKRQGALPASSRGNGPGSGISVRRAAVIDALNKSIEIFTSHNEKNLEEVMNNGIRPIADAVGLDRVVFYPRRDIDGEVRLGQTFLWDKGAGGLISLDDELTVLPNTPLMARWIATTSSGGCVKLRESEMAADEQAFLSRFGIKSIMILPIFSHGQFWGGVSFQEHSHDWYFDKDCFDLLSSAAYLFANAIIKDEIERKVEESINALKRRDELISTLNKAAILFLSRTEKTFEDTMTAGVRLIADVVNMDRLSVWRNTMMSDGLHTSQIYRWDRVSGGTTTPTPGLENTTYAKLAPRWEQFLASGEVINSPVYLLPEAAMLKSFGVVSAFIVPIFLNNIFWGFVLMEDRRVERYFDDESAEMMRSAAFLCANTVTHAKMERDTFEAGQRTKLMLDTIPISCQWWDKNMNVIDCNNAAVKLFGVNDKQEFLDTFFKLSPEYQPNGRKSEEVAIEAVKKAFEDGKYEFEWMHRLADGTLMDAEINLERIKYGDDNILVGYVRDLRRQKRLMNDIEEANKYNRATLDAAPVGINVFGDNLSLLDCNDTVLNLFKCDKQYYLDHFSEFSPEYQPDGVKSNEKIAAVVARALNGENLTFDWVHRSLSGELIPSEVFLTRIKFKGKYVVLGYQYDLRNIKKMEQEIINASELNRTVIESAPVGITVFDDNYRIIDCNDAIVNAYGGTREQYVNNFFDFSPEYQEDGSRSDDKIMELLELTMMGERVVCEWTHRSVTGELLPFEISTIRVKYNEKYRGIAFQYNLSNIKRMEHAVVEAEDLTRTVIETSPVSYMLFDEQFRPEDCNDVLLKMLGCCDKLYFLEHYWDTFVPESQPDGKNSLDSVSVLTQAMIFNEQITFEWLQRSMDGELIPVENTLKRIIYKGKDAFIVFKYDMRNIKKMMENIREQGEMLKIRLEQQELISEISKGFIASGDSETHVKEAIAKLGHYHDVSQVSIFAIDYHEGRAHMAYQWSARDMPAPMVRIELIGIIQSSFPERLPDCATMPVISCDDIAASANKDFRSLLAIDVAAFICAPLYVEGKLWGVLSVQQFSRPRQWTDNEKTFVAMTASTIAGVIMRDIYNNMLKKAMNKATAASRAKGEFLSNMSHEMRTPLNAIIGMTAIGKTAADIERKNYALDKIDNASAHLLGVINDVLDMSKIEANMLELSPVEFNFEKMLQRVVNVVNFRIEERQQKFVIHIDRNIPETLVGDDQRLAQVITNLLGNAVKFTPEHGSITLDVCLIREEDSLCTVQVSVSDTGIGISPEQQKRVFSSFEQAESSTTRKYGGSGLGLAISKTIVEMMGGEISLESKLGKGSTFTFTVQMRRGSAKKQGLLAADINWSNVHIMVVDDDPDILEYVRETIQKIGAVCDTATSGKEALRLVEQNGSYHIYFVDWKMPNIDGVTLTSMLKEKQADPNNTVVIMISSVEWNTVEVEARKAGVDKFLSKPLFSSTIVDVLGECLGVNQEQVEEAPFDLTGCFEGHRILLVEDVEINREIVLALLETTLLEIDCAENGVEAVRMFSETPQKYELIFMDVQMPEMDGYEATRQIRAMNFPESQTIPIVAMTANVFREDIEKCLESGMNDHIGKPLGFEDVMNKLRGYLKN